MQIQPAPNGVVPEFRSANLEPGLSGTTPRSCAVRGRLVCRQWAYLVGKPRAVGLAIDPFASLAHLPRSCGAGPSRDRTLKLLGDMDRRIREDPEKVCAEIKADLLRSSSRPLPAVRTAARRPSERHPRCRRSSRRQRRSTAGGGVPRGPISSLGASPRSAARRLLGAIDRRIRHDIMMSLRGRGPWIVLHRPGSITFVPRHLRQRLSRGRQQGRASALRCGRPSPKQSRSSGRGEGGGGSGSGEAGSSAGDSSDGVSGDAGKPALDRWRTIEARACLGGRRAF